MRSLSSCITLAFLAIPACSHRSPSPSATGSVPATSAAAGAVHDESSSPPTSATGLKWQANYDSQGRVVTLEDAAGHITRFQYESDERGLLRKVIRAVDGGSRVIFQFDELGRIAALHDALGTVQYEYDGFSRLVAARREGAPPVCMTFDSADRITALRVGDSAVGYQYDALGRLAAMETPAGRVTYDFQPSKHQVHRMLPNGVVTTWQYMLGGQLASMTHASGSRTLAGFVYHYRPDGRIQSFEEQESAGDTLRTIRWEYDAEGRLIAAGGAPNVRSTYKYDLLGNRTSRHVSGFPEVASTFDWAGRLLTHKGEPCRYDGAGNVADCLDDRGRRSFSYTNDNLLQQVDGRVTYEYDGWGNLVGRKTAGGSQSFIPDPQADIWRPLLTQGTDGSRTLLVWEGDHLLAQVTSDGPQFFLEDRFGSIRCVADSSGRVAAHQRFSPFGIPEKGIGKQGLHPAFAGLFYDVDTGLYLTKARAYHPDLGFLQPDPIHRPPNGATWDMSPYVWCGHDPNLVDTDGCEPQPPRMFADDERLHQIRRMATAVQAFQQASTVTSPSNSSVAPSSSTVRQNLGLPTVHFHSVLALGWGDGARPHQDLLKQAAGRFEMIDLTAPSPRGIVFGDVPKALNYDFVTARTGERSTPYTSDTVVAHSGGNHLRFSGNPEIVRIGPSSQNEQFNSGRSQVIFPDVVSRLTKLTPNLEQGYAGVKISGRFDSNPLKGVVSLGKNVGDVARGFVELPHAVATGFESHAKTTHFKTLDQMHVVPDRGTYQQVQVRTPRSVYTYTSSDGSNWELKGQSTQLQPPDDSKKVAPPPGGGSSGAMAPSSGTLGQGYTYGTPFDAITNNLIGNNLVSVQPSVSKWISESGHSPTAADSPAGPEVPSNIGGVYLGGAKIFNDCGQLRGVYFDKESGRLTLLTEDGKNRLLPPLGLDEIVTVFRAVYSGEAPFVSIDPDPQDPKGKQMLVRHSQATAGTYTGWICFEADRVMKGASLGVDNDSGQPFRPAIPGYDNLLKLNHRRSTSRNEQWERFWIVSGVECRRASSEGAAFLDISMLVKTQVMKLRGGKLESDLHASSSREAADFTEWFTEHYPEIETALSSTPPADNGISEPIAVFTELKRLALLTAAAEALRDQGVPLPTWMNDYRVRKFHVPQTTPAIRTQRQETVGNTTYTQQAYGGVTLSPREGRGWQERPATPQQAALAAELTRMARQSPQLAPVVIESGGERLQAVAMPTDRGVALGASQLREADLAVPLAGGGTLNLARRFHSFFSPHDVFGDSGWTLDLPRLERQLTEIGRTGNQVKYSVNFRLASPLSSYTGIVQVEKGHDSRLGSPSLVVRRTVHPVLHFEEESGLLLAVEEGSHTTIYRRDTEHRLVRLESWAGQRREADIQLNYDKRQRVVSAHDSNGSSVRYAYDGAGNLARVERQNGVVTYQYADGLVNAVGDERGVRRHFEYNGRGQLISESLADGTEQQFAYDLGADGRPRLTMRSLENDGTSVERQVRENGSEIVRWETPGGLRHRMALKPDEKRLYWQLPSGGIYCFQRDSSGHVVKVLQDRQPAFEQAWTERGQLSLLRWAGTEIRSDYQPSGELRQLRIRAEVGAAANEPQATLTLDQQARPRSLADGSGATWDFSYDGENLTSSRCHDGAGTVLSAVDCERTSDGRMRLIRTSWGDEQRYAYDGNVLKRMETLRAGKSAAIDFQAGRPTLIHDFDGGETTITYGPTDQVERLRTPGGLTFAFQYDAEQRLNRVQCGKSYAWHYDYDEAGRLVGIAQVSGKE